jgi:hypothetical protein
MEKRKLIKRPRAKGKRQKIVSSVDRDVFLILDMLGFHIPSLIEHTLSNVAGHKKCPCCGRQVKPLIIGRKIND